MSMNANGFTAETIEKLFSAQAEALLNRQLEIFQKAEDAAWERFISDLKAPKGESDAANYGIGDAARRFLYQRRREVAASNTVPFAPSAALVKLRDELIRELTRRLISQFVAEAASTKKLIEEMKKIDHEQTPLFGVPEGTAQP